MSTSYELGLFTNSKSNNDVTILVGIGYQNRQNCPIGDYIVKAHKKFVEYPAHYNEKAHLYFQNNITPTVVQNKVDEDLRDIKNEDTIGLISFNKEFPAIQKYCEFSYTASINFLKFHFSLKTLFYFLDAIIKDEKIDVYNQISLETIENKICENLFYNFVENSNDDIVELYKFRRPKIEFVINNYESDSIIKHVFWIIKLIEDYNYINSYNAVRNINSKEAYQYIYTNDYFIDYENNFKKLFNLSRNDSEIIKDYCDNPKAYIRNFSMKVHKKNRLITTYANNQKGRRLRELHNKIKDVMEELLPTSDVSYAYKKGKSILMCLEEHTNSTYFYKLDITKFFESIRKSLLSRVISKILLTKLISNYHLRDRGINKVKFHKNIAYLLNVCFLNGKLPIGFVTSPKLSDIFLYDLDENIRNQSEVIVTRYADDYLISTANENTVYVDLMVSKIKGLLKQKTLEINPKKEFKRQFKYEGDSIKFLGANIVCTNTKEKNKITISHKYIIETSKLIQKAMFNRRANLKEECLGRCNYIKNVSLESYEKLELIYKKHTNKSLGDIIKRI